MTFRVFIDSLVRALAGAPAAHAVSYEAPLPVQLSTDPDMCAYAPCRDVIAADSFSLRKGRPSYVEAYRTEGEQKQLVGYVFLSTDIYFGYLNVPSIGISILGENNYRRLIADLMPGEHAIFVIANGVASFKGSGFVRGGIYDRIQVAQERDSFIFRDTDYLNLYSIQAAGAPRYTESGIFIIRGASFSAAYPWHLVFLANRVDRETGTKTFVNFDQAYWVPAKYLEGGRPPYERPK